jgi:2-amino-4-hydroxy-6-hydroxymethyldihydropteridine diphosphokinase
MILVALGANLPGPAGPPLAQCEAALERLRLAGIAVVARSPWYESTPWPPSDQPRFVNGVVAVETRLRPAELLAALHEVERALGRLRGVRNAARPIDLDLIDYDGIVMAGPEPPVLPHPRLGERDFVLRPLADIAPAWRHPVSGLAVGEMLARLPHDPTLVRVRRPSDPDERFNN